MSESSSQSLKAFRGKESGHSRFFQALLTGVFVAYGFLRLFTLNHTETLVGKLQVTAVPAKKELEVNCCPRCCYEDRSQK